jgi:hypothetical protein
MTKPSIVSNCRRGFSAGALLLLTALLLSSCGYHIGGQAALIPKTVKTIAIPPFGNATPRYQIGRLVPADLAREFHSRTRYTIVTDPAQADAVLTGAVTNFAASPTTTDPVSGRSTGAQVIVILQVTLTERQTGKVLFTRSGYEFRERYEVATDPKTYFDESGTAIQRVSRDLARSVVSAILEAF